MQPDGSIELQQLNREDGNEGAARRKAARRGAKPAEYLSRRVPGPVHRHRKDTIKTNNKPGIIQRRCVGNGAAACLRLALVAVRCRRVRQSSVGSRAVRTDDALCNALTRECACVRECSVMPTHCACATWPGARIYHGRHAQGCALLLLAVGATSYG